MEAAATAQRRHVRQLTAICEAQRVEAAATAQRRYVRQLTAIMEVQRVEAAATAQRRHVRQLSALMRFSVWRLLQLPSTDGSLRQLHPWSACGGCCNCPAPTRPSVVRTH